MTHLYASPGPNDLTHRAEYLQRIYDLLFAPQIYVDLTIDQSHKSHNAPVSYPTMHHSKQKCEHFCYEWCIVGFVNLVYSPLNTP